MEDEKRGPPTEEEFHEQRSRGIGGSDAGTILGLNPWATPLQLYYKKRREFEEDEDEERQELEWGNRLEGPIIQKLFDATGHTIVHHTHATGYRQHSRIEWLLCHLDGEWWWPSGHSLLMHPDDVLHPMPRNPPPAAGVVEVKNVTGWKVDDWGMAPPLYVQAQVQHNMAVTGLPHSYIAALIGGNQFRKFETEPNIRFIKAMLEKEAEFWHRVKTGRPPKAEPGDSKFLSQFLKVDSKTVITLPGEALDLDAHRQHADAQIKKWKKVKDAADARLKQLIGTDWKGNLTSGVSYTFSETKGGTYTTVRKPTRTLRRSKGK